MTDPAPDLAPSPGSIAEHESEERLRLALEAGGLGTWDFDPISGVLTWDDRCRALFGLDPDAEITYDVFLRGLHPADRAWVDAAVQSALDPEGPGAYDVEYRTVGLEDDVERWVSARGQTLFDDERRARRF